MMISGSTMVMVSIFSMVCSAFGGKIRRNIECSQLTACNMSCHSIVRRNSSVSHCRVDHITCDGKLVYGENHINEILTIVKNC
ncbi:MAG: hypothetical protein ACLTJG_02275 [[Clostridium] innocuum]